MTNPFVTFNYATFVARYPEFAPVPEGTAVLYFNEATLYLRNDGTGPVTSPTFQLMMLNMLTAHLAWLAGWGRGAVPITPSGVVGRIASATEGSVSVSVENNYAPGSAQWFQQTPYGAAYWQATAPYRQMRYVPGYTFEFQRGPVPSYGRWRR